jgi:signal transduction histidine kinase
MSVATSPDSEKDGEVAPVVKRTSLRTSLTAFLAVVTAFASIVAAALVLLTTRMQAETALVADSLRSVRVAQGLELDLLLYARAEEPVVRQTLRAKVERSLIEMEAYVTTEEEEGVLRAAAAAVERYLAHAAQGGRAPGASDPLLDEPVRAIAALVNLNIRQAQAAEELAEQWDRTSNYVGYGAMALVIFGSVGGALWLRRYAFRPLFRLADEIQRYTAGDQQLRVSPDGPAELDLIGQRFNELADRLARRREEQLAFLASIAHDLRNPMTALSLALATVRPDEPLPAEEKIRRIFDVMAHQTGRLRRMVGDLLDTAAIEAGRLDLHLETADLRPQIEEVVALYREAAPEREIEVALPSTPVPVHADTTRIQQVLENLLSNALKYSPDRSKVRLSLEVAAGDVCVSVTDQGIGIPEAEQPHVFEPFRRTSASREGYPGAGLGLAVVRNIVAAHGGGLELESEPGKGTTFRVHLPRAA